MNELNEKVKSPRRADIVVISSLLFITILFLLFAFLFKKEGAFVVVEIDGTTTGEYSLIENGVFPLNGGTNTLVIENGKAYLINSSCPDHTCETTGRIHYIGQTIICLPNKLSVTVKGNADDGVDLVS